MMLVDSRYSLFQSDSYFATHGQKLEKEKNSKKNKVVQSQKPVSSKRNPDSDQARKMFKSLKSPPFRGIFPKLWFLHQETKKIKSV